MDTFTGIALPVAGIVGFAAGFVAAALRRSDARDADAEACLGLVDEERRRCPPRPIKVLVVRERGNAEWLAERARRN